MGNVFNRTQSDVRSSFSTPPDSPPLCPNMKRNKRQRDKKPDHSPSDHNSNKLRDGDDSHKMVFKYQDYSHVLKEDLARQLNPNVPRSEWMYDRTHDASDDANGSGNIRSKPFPLRLYTILACKEFQDIITWMPHGRSWKVLDQGRFETEVMPFFFDIRPGPQMAAGYKYESFTRVANAWCFRRKLQGPDRGSYFHELFLRGKPHLLQIMRRLPTTHKKLPMKACDDPDFFHMDKCNPLPPLSGNFNVEENIALTKVAKAGLPAQASPGRSRRRPQTSNPNQESSLSRAPNLTFRDGFTSKIIERPNMMKCNTNDSNSIHKLNSANSRPVFLGVPERSVRNVLSDGRNGTSEINSVHACLGDSISNLSGMTVGRGGTVVGTMAIGVESPKHRWNMAQWPHF